MRTSGRPPTSAKSFFCEASVHDHSAPSLAGIYGNADPKSVPYTAKVEEATVEERKRRIEAALHAGTGVRAADTSEMDKKAAGFATAQVDYIYEQPPEELFRDLLPRYISVQLYRAMLESEAAEHAARMTAMDSATNNASDMIDALTLQMNRVRQAKITKEIIEVLKTPEMVKNIENFRFISENMSETSTRIQNILKQLEDTGVMSEARELIKSSKSTVDSFNGSGQDLHEINVAVKEMFKSIRTFVDELKITAVS